MEYLVVYASKTGNTEKIAMSIFETLPGNSKDIQKIEELKGEADTYFIGFWNNRGSCNGAIMDLLSDLHGKKIALFGTCGMGGSREYFDQVAKQVAAFISDDNEYLGDFMCAGKMPPQILEKYKQMQLTQDTPQIRMMIQAYEMGMLHPDEEDCRAAGAFTREVLKK
ncbi:MAG: flavodoxin family protein [Hungatella sp.]